MIRTCIIKVLVLNRKKSIQVIKYRDVAFLEENENEWVEA